MYQSIASVQCLEVYLTRCIKGLNAITIVTASPGWKEKAVMLRIGLAGRRKENPADSIMNKEKHLLEVIHSNPSF